MLDDENRDYILVANDTLGRAFALYDATDADQLCVLLNRLRDGLVVIAANRDEPYAADAANDLLAGKEIVP